MNCQIPFKELLQSMKTFNCSINSSKISNRFQLVKLMFREKSKTSCQKNYYQIQYHSYKIKREPQLLVYFLQKLINDAIISGKFPGNLKLADDTQVFEKENPLGKTKYRPVSVLSTIFKIFEKGIEKQLNHYLQNFLSPYLRGCWKGYIIRVPKVLFRFFDKLKYEIKNKVLIFVSILKLRPKT